MNIQMFKLDLEKAEEPKIKLPNSAGSSTHSIVLAWRIPGTAESGGLPSMGSHRVGHNRSYLAAAAAAAADRSVVRWAEMLHAVPGTLQVLEDCLQW